jgi:hypothetical protein
MPAPSGRRTPRATVSPAAALRVPDGYGLSSGRAFRTAAAA